MLKMITLLVLLAVSTSAKAVTLSVTIQGKDLGGKNWAEFKAESDQKNGEVTTGHITTNQEKTCEWDMGGSNQNIWFFLDTLVGSAHITVKVDGVVVFDGDCIHDRTGEVRVKDTCVNPTVYKTDGSPYLVEWRRCDTHVFFRGR